MQIRNIESIGKDLEIEGEKPSKLCLSYFALILKQIQLLLSD